jgi:hypothetical protein
MSKAFGIPMAAVLMASATGSAGEEPKAAPANAAQVTVIGLNYCAGCALKKERGAAAQCSVYGHRHSLKVEKALDESGKEIAGVAGRTLAYLDNDKSTKLVKGDAFHKERVEVKGKLYEPEGILEVLEFKAP